jgi:hypothetical protein
VFWGTLHGFALAIERFFGQFIKLPNNAIIKFVKVFLTFHFVSFAWLFFRAKDFQTVLKMLNNISELQFDLQVFSSIFFAYQSVFLLILLGFITHFIPNALKNKALKIFSNLPFIVRSLLLGIIFWLVYITASSETQAFIYFQF